MQENEMKELFVTPVFRKKLSLDNSKILTYCLSLEKKDSGRTVSNMGGWQSNDIVGNPKELTELNSLISDFSSEICQIMQIEPVKLYNSWVNINRYKDCNWPHTHDDAILSGVYYVKTSEDTGNIQFNNPNSISGNLRINNYNKFNAPDWWLPTTEGVLYVFPSWVRHGVQINMNKSEERVSISFNLIH